jgi:DNA-directed RNA polymerase subunit M/transcription elongation factor TFIIS
MEKRKLCLGLCPKCGNDEITYLDGYVKDESYVYEVVCDSCETEFKEYYDINYSETIWEE